MEELFVRRGAQFRMHDGSLGEHIDAFICTLADKGYGRSSRRRAAWLLSDFSRWLPRRGFGATEITEERIDAFLRYRKRRRAPRAEDRSACCSGEAVAVGNRTASSPLDGGSTSIVSRC